jgi:hypothetical protein
MSRRGKGQDNLFDDLSRFRRHHQNAIGQKQRLFHVMGDESSVVGRQPGFAQELLHHQAGLRIQCTEGFVQ